jgi:hypothetical protein
MPINSYEFSPPVGEGRGEGCKPYFTLSFILSHRGRGNYWISQAGQPVWGRLSVLA